MSYFTCSQTRAVVNDRDVISKDDSRPDLLKARYELDRKIMMTEEKENKIDELFKVWCDLLVAGYNLVILGPNSKFFILETFREKYLESGELPDWTSSRNPPVALDIMNVRLHGLDPIKMETFTHAIFGIKETRKLKDYDYTNFGAQLKELKMHYIFLIHSAEYFIDYSEDVFETICKLCVMYPKFVHLVMSSDHWNGGRRIKQLQHQLQLVYSRSVMSAVDSFLWEKTKTMCDFDLGDAKSFDTTVHRLFADKTDLQSLKDIHQAIDGAKQKILAYIVKDLIDKTESNNVAAVASKKRFRGFDAEDDEEHPLEEEDKVERPPVVPMRARRTNANYNTTDTSQKKSETKTIGRRSVAQRALATHLDFQHLLKYCESKFIVRRGATLRDHLGELKDHNLISLEDAGNRIQCLVDLDIGKKFLSWIDEQSGA